MDGGDAVVNGLAGIKVGVPARIDVEVVVIQEAPEIRIGFIRYTGRFRGVDDGTVVDVVIGGMDEEDFVGGRGFGHLKLKPGHLSRINGAAQAVLGLIRGQIIRIKHGKEDVAIGRGKGVRQMVITGRTVLGIFGKYLLVFFLVFEI